MTTVKIEHNVLSILLEKARFVVFFVTGVSRLRENYLLQCQLKHTIINNYNGDIHVLTEIHALSDIHVLTDILTDLHIL